MNCLANSRFFLIFANVKYKQLEIIGMFSVNNNKKSCCGRYKGVYVWQLGCMIGNGWYGTFYCTKKKNGRNYKVKDSECRSLEALKEYIDKHLDELK